MPPSRSDFLGTMQALGIDPDALTADSNGTIVRPRTDIVPADDDMFVPGSIPEIEQLPAITTRTAEDRAGELELHDLLGEGGMGLVHDATQLPLRRHVAVKTVHPGSRTHRNTSALLREAWITGSLQHPNVIPIHALGKNVDGEPLMVMKRVDGVSWKTLLQEDGEHPAIDKNDRLGSHLQILLAVCNAVAFAHDLDLIHRDLKPDNVMLGAFGEVYVVDWGLAVSVSSDPPDKIPQIHDIDTIEGTPHFMAPEMAYCEPSRIGKPSDVYQLGAILHLILTGRPRNEGETLVDALCAAYEVTPYRYDSDVPAELAALANRATASDPSFRFADALAFRAALSSFVHHRHAHAVTERSMRRLEELRAVIANDTQDESARRRAQELVTEARFGFQTALKDWPESGRAKLGLSDLLAAACQYELASDRFHQAEGLYTELSALGPPPEAVRIAFEAGRKKHHARKDDVQRLQAELRVHEIEAAQQESTFAIPMTGLFFTAVFALYAFADHLGWFAVTHELNVGRAILFATVQAIVVGRLTQQKSPNRVIIRFKSAFLSTGAVDVLLAGLGMVMGLSVLHAMALLMFTLGGFFFTVAATIDRRLVPVGPVFIAFAFAAVLIPQWGYFIVAAANLAGPVLATQLWQRDNVRERYG